MTDLCRLAEKYGTDKFPWYTPFYHSLFANRRETVHRVLEIGIGSVNAMKHVPGYKPGASLRMWRDYFPNAVVVGVDKDSSILFQEDRIECLCADQQSNGWYLTDCDLIVDDGSHEPEDQVRTAVRLLPYLSPDGIYIIEDVNGHLDLPFAHQDISCYVPNSPLVGRCVLLRK